MLLLGRGPCCYVRVRLYRAPQADDGDGFLPAEDDPNDSRERVFLVGVDIR